MTLWCMRKAGSTAMSVHVVPVAAAVVQSKRVEGCVNSVWRRRNVCSV